MNERYAAVRAVADSPNCDSCQSCRSYLPRFWTTNGLIPDSDNNLFRDVCTENRPRSHPIQRRFIFSATTTDVPLPRKQSRTKSPGLEVVSMTRSSRDSGFWVG